MSEHMMPIPSRLYNAAVGGHVTGADQIIDDDLQKNQAVINSEVNSALGGKQDTLQFDNAPTQNSTKMVNSGAVYSAIQNFVTKTVNDLVNYYTKSDTYTRNEVQQLIAAVKQFTCEVVPTLPTPSASTMNKIYLTPAAQTATQNIKDEYITIATTNNGTTTYNWEQIGSTTIDLSGYYTKQQTDAAIALAINSALASYSTTSQMNTAISNAVSAEQSRAQAAEEQLRTLYNNLQQSQPIPVTTLPTTGEAGKIYRLAGTTSYADYMYAEGALTTPIKMAEYDNAIDDEPTAGSHNLVESGGIYKATHILGEEIQTSLTNAWVSTDLGTDIRTINMRTDRLVTDLLNAQPLSIASQNPNLQCAVAVADSSYSVIRSYLYQNLPLEFNPEEGDYYVRLDFKDTTLPTTSTLVDNTLSITSGNISINDINNKVGVLEEKVGSITHSRIRNKYFADAIIRTLPGSSEESSVGNRLKFIFKVSEGDKLFSRLNVLDKNNYMVIFDTLENAKKVSPDGILQQIYDGFTKHAIFAESEVDGYLAIITKKDDNSAITDAEMQTMIDGMDIYIGPNANFIENENLKKIYFDSYAQNKYSATGIADEDPTRVTCKSVIAVPYPSAELTFVLPPYIKAGIRCSGDASNLNTNLYWFINGDKVTLPSNARFLIISLGKQVATGGPQPSIFNPQDDATTQDENVSVEEVSGYIERGELYMYYNDRYSGEIVDKNSAEEKYIKAVKYKFTNTLSTNSNPNRLPLLIHTSDVHGDYTRFNRVLDYADYIDADGVLTTGDMSAWNGNSHMDYINDAFKTHKSLGLICVGNHDAFGSNRQVSAQYENVMKASIDKFGYSVNSIDYPTYYYKDIASKLIRVIGLNEFEKTDADANQSYYSQTQINWLISVLALTPANYGVIIIMHRPEEAISKIEGYDKFYQDSTPYAQYQSLSITGHPISTIVDAFISKASINTQFTEVNPDTNTNETVNIVADFTGLNSGVEFLFFANGHEHSDRIGVAPNVTNRQLVLNVLSCIGLYDPSNPYYAEISDIPRGNGSTQDAFNMYAIDRENKQVRIARIGSNKSSMLTDRDYMIVSYV